MHTAKTSFKKTAVISTAGNAPPSDCKTIVINIISKRSTTNLLYKCIKKLYGTSFSDYLLKEEICNAMQSRYYPDEGKLTGYRCPNCGAIDIECTIACYEFSTLECQACGYSATLDDLQITDWFALEN